MAIGDRIRIVTEKEYRIMSPPRRSRGEKPRTTIRYLNHTISELQKIIDTYRSRMDDQHKQIASQAVELSECADREKILTTELENSADGYGSLLAMHQKNTTRLAYLEGYYAKSTETIRTASEGDSRSHSYGAAVGQEGEPEDIARRYGGPAGGQVWRFHPDDPTPHHRRSMDRDPIAGTVHDATTSELERHRR